jgi:hypothetical protein
VDVEVEPEKSASGDGLLNIFLGGLSGLPVLPERPFHSKMYLSW